MTNKRENDNQVVDWVTGMKVTTLRDRAPAKSKQELTLRSCALARLQTRMAQHLEVQTGHG
jgi:hypothetical protein